MLQAFCRRMLCRSPWVFHANGGGCNGCDIEVLDALTPYYDAERLGVRLVASPRHADVMLCQGPALRSTAAALRRAYDAMPAPKKVVAVGSCAAGGGPWHDSYAVIGGVDRLLPVDAYVPGCPPRPEAIIHGLAVALGLLPKQVAPEATAQEPVPMPRYRRQGELPATPAAPRPPPP